MMTADEIRYVEMRIAYEYHSGDIKTPIHLCLGQESIPVEICAALRPDDRMFAYYRSHGWYLAKGGNLQRMLDELYGKRSGCSHGVGGSMHLIDRTKHFHGTTAIVGAQLPHAVGCALALKMQGNDAVTVCAFGDGATEQGVFMESLMFAALHKLKILFVCMNDGLATNVPTRQRQPFGTSIFQRGEPFGVDAFQTNSEDCTSDRIRILLHKIAQYSQPHLIEVKIEREWPHVGIGNATDIGIEIYSASKRYPEIDACFEKAKEKDIPVCLF